MGEAYVVDHADHDKMSQEPEFPVRDRAEWILRLLYAEDEYGRQNTPLYGKTRLQKACFLLHRKLNEKFDVETGFNFRPDKFGPFDPGIYDAVTFLENQEWLEADSPDEHEERYDLVRYQLTENGLEKAANLYNELGDPQQDLVFWVKNKHALKKLGRLLTYVYNEYPEMTTKSELV